MAPVTAYVEEIAGKPVKKEVAARLRVLAQVKHGLSPIEQRATPNATAALGTATARDRLLDTEIIAIYW